MIAPSLLCFFPLTVLLGLGIFAAPVIGPVVTQSPQPRTPITAANASRVIDWGEVVTSDAPVRFVDWLPGDALIALTGEGETAATLTYGPLADPFMGPFMITVRADHRLAVSPDGTRIAVINPDPVEDDQFEMLVYALDSEMIPQNADVHPYFKGEPGPVAYSPDGTQIAVVAYVDEMSVIFRLDAASGELLGRDEIPARVDAIRFAPDGASMVTGGEDGLRLLAIDVVQLREVWSVAAPGVSALVVGEDRIIAGQGEGPLAAYRPADGAVEWEFDPGAPVTALALSPGGDVLAVGQVSGEIELRDAASGALIISLQGADGPVNALAFHLDGSLIAAAAGESLHLYGLPANEGPAMGGPGTSGPVIGGTLSGPPPTPGPPLSDGTYPVDPPGDSE